MPPEDYSDGYDEVIIPAYIRENETEHTQLLVKEKVVEINSDLNSIGQSLVGIAENLSILKANLVRDKSWTAFIQSDVCPLSPKSAADLVNAHDKWLAKWDGNPALLAGMSARALNIMANASPKGREKVYGAVEAGEITGSEREVKRIIDPAKKPKPKAGLVAMKDLDANTSDAEKVKHATKIMNQQGSQITQLSNQKDRLLKDQREKQGTIAKLREELKQMKDELAAATDDSKKVGRAGARTI